MKKLFSFILSLTLLSSIILSGCGGTTTERAPMYTGSVVGQIFDDETNNIPVANVTIKINNNQTKSDSEGKFKLSNISFDNDIININIEYGDKSQELKKQINKTIRDQKIFNLGVIYLTSKSKIYACGYSEKEKYSGDISICYWSIFDNNNSRIDLGTTSIYRSDTIYPTIYGCNNKIYITGSGSDISSSYWVDNNKLSIDNNYSSRTVFVSNNDLYFGAKNDTLYYFINNTPHQLKNLKNEPATGDLKSIYVYNNKVYTAGYCYYRTEPGVFPCYWVNDTPVKLDTYGRVNSMVVYDNKVYSAGYTSDYAGGDRRGCYWIDNLKVDLNFPGEINSIFVNKNNVYCVGENSYWINKTKFSLDNLDYGRVIYIYNDTIYIGGNTNGGYGFPFLLKIDKNGIKSKTIFDETYGAITGLFVTE